MTTKLDSPVTRLTTLEVDGREVEVTLMPMDVGKCDPEALLFRLKGTKKGEIVVPLPVLLRALGWKVKLGEAIRPQGGQKNMGLMPGLGQVDLDKLISDLERQFGKGAA